MNYPSIRIEGAILSPDFLGQLEEIHGQKPKDFGLDSRIPVKDEIGRAWADAQDYWRLFRIKLDKIKKGSYATSETRNLWIVPLLSLLHYEIEYRKAGVELNGRVYAISHRVTNQADTVLHIVGISDKAGLDRKPENANRRMSAHALVQEYLNIDDHLYGMVTNGRVLRLLRDNPRLVKQSFLEFDLERIFTDNLYADFAVLFRLLHATRLPVTVETAHKSLIERYHQDSLESGARIREGLGQAVEKAVLCLGNGFLTHPDNDTLRNNVKTDALSASDVGENRKAREYYRQILRLIYRLLFLMVIEERDLVYPDGKGKSWRKIYRQNYSVLRLRRLSESRKAFDTRHHDLWDSLQASFRLFESHGPGIKLEIAPLASDFFSAEGIDLLSGHTLSNKELLKTLFYLGVYQNPISHQRIRVNYAALSVEEFGSIYERLLDFEPRCIDEGKNFRFELGKGKERAASGSHYTPDELVLPLIRHSLDHLIEECRKTNDSEKALLNLRVADIACGSGHILLAAARRIATNLAEIRTGEEQPSPVAYRNALRDVIRQCIYGVDINPLAVELCKVALWLEAHIPGEPLSFLDHHIKCGNAIVGFARFDDLERGVPTEAFKQLNGDDKETAAAVRSANKRDRKEISQKTFDAFADNTVLHGRLNALLNEWKTFSALPGMTPDQIEAKKIHFADFTKSEHTKLLRSIADIPIAQFFLPKVPDRKETFVTDTEFRNYWHGERVPKGEGVKAARKQGENEKFFHWFLEFPEIMKHGGFDCILGNPPYLGDKGLSGIYGYKFCECLKWLFNPAGINDLVIYFLRRVNDLLRKDCFAAIITTNSIVDGKIRRYGLDQIIKNGSQINMAIRAIMWPGAANLVVSLLAFYKGSWNGLIMLDNQRVKQINSFFEAEEINEDPQDFLENRNRVFIGHYYCGNGFLLANKNAEQMCINNPKNREVIMPFINGKEINEIPDQASDRSIINFRNWPIERAKEYPHLFAIVEETVKPERENQNDQKLKKYWWLFARSRPKLSRALHVLTRCFVAARTTKYMALSAIPTNYIISDACCVFATDRWDLFTVIQSIFHEVWARKYSSSFGQNLRYSPSKCFLTFAFPVGLLNSPDSKLTELGKCYHSLRLDLMQSLWIGLTKVYDLFHNQKLTPDLVARESKKNIEIATAEYETLLELRLQHREIDLAVRDAYGWQDLDLEHDFHDIEYLPENDRNRYTISSSARREVLQRLLVENHSRAKSDTMTSLYKHE